MLILPQGRRCVFFVYPEPKNKHSSAERPSISHAVFIASISEKSPIWRNSAVSKIERVIAIVMFSEIVSRSWHGRSSCEFPHKLSSSSDFPRFPSSCFEFLRFISISFDFLFTEIVSRSWSYRDRYRIEIVIVSRSLSSVHLLRFACIEIVIVSRSYSYRDRYRNRYTVKITFWPSGYTKKNATPPYFHDRIPEMNMLKIDSIQSIGKSKKKVKK